MRYILDTSAILSGKDIPMTQEMYVPPKVLDEIQKGGRWFKKLQRLRAAGLKVVDPPGPVIEEVAAGAKRTGDSIRLSDTDIQVIALAMHMEGTILTDDYSIQNLAKVLGIKYHGVAKKEITEEYTWSYRCKKCGRYYKEPKEECDVCGGKIKTVKLTDYDR